MALCSAVDDELRWRALYQRRGLARHNLALSINSYYIKEYLMPSMRHKFG